MLRGLADSLILLPSREEIPVVGKTRRLVQWKGGSAEVWIERANCDSTDDARVFVLKLIGAAGRAERATIHPLDAWHNAPGEIWTVNPPGYGGSPGRAGVGGWGPSALAAYGALAEQVQGRPIVISANSLGTAAALWLAASRPVAGLILRNPPPLRRLIFRHYGWWNLYLASGLVAALMPRQLDSIKNAARVTRPGLIVTSAADRTVPPKFQDLVYNAYAGPKRRLVLDDADHADTMSAEQRKQYLELLKWLWEAMRIDGRPSE